MNKDNKLIAAILAVVIIFWAVSFIFYRMVTKESGVLVPMQKVVPSGDEGAVSRYAIPAGAIPPVEEIEEKITSVNQKREDYRVMSDAMERERALRREEAMALENKNPPVETSPEGSVVLLEKMPPAPLTPEEDERMKSKGILRY